MASPKAPQAALRLSKNFSQMSKSDPATVWQIIESPSNNANSLPSNVLFPDLFGPWRLSLGLRLTKAMSRQWKYHCENHNTSYHNDHFRGRQL